MKKLITAFTIIMLVMIMTPVVSQADYQTERKTLYYGQTHTEVKNLQQDLKDIGYFTFYKTTNYFGSITYNAVIRFQKDYGLSADGIVGSQTSRAIKKAKVAQTAKSYYGVPYVWGGTSSSGFDCSGFTHYVFLKNDIVIPRVSADQYYAGTWVNRSQLQIGDMVFFTTYKPGPSHVGIYIGNNKFIHASSGAEKVTISDLDNPYYKQRYIGAKRVIK